MKNLIIPILFVIASGFLYLTVKTIVVDAAELPKVEHVSNAEKIFIYLKNR